MKYQVRFLQNSCSVLSRLELVYGGLDLKTCEQKFLDNCCYSAIFRDISMGEIWGKCDFVLQALHDKHHLGKGWEQIL